MTLNLFIDTNIYLAFYHFTDDDLNELEKLVALLKSKQIKIFLPEQVLNEFRRNREKKIKEAINTLKNII